MRRACHRALLQADGRTMLSNPRRASVTRQLSAMVAIAAILLAPTRDIAQAQAPAASAPAAIDGGWPRALVSGGKAEMVLYQPQIASWDSQKRMVAYAA